MRASELVVVAVAICAIAWVNWYFFLAERDAAPAGKGAADDRATGT